MSRQSARKIIRPIGDTYLRRRRRVNDSKLSSINIAPSGDEIKQLIIRNPEFWEIQRENNNSKRIFRYLMAMLDVAISMDFYYKFINKF